MDNKGLTRDDKGFTRNGKSFARDTEFLHGMLETNLDKGDPYLSHQKIKL